MHRFSAKEDPVSRQGEKSGSDALLRPPPTDLITLFSYRVGQEQNRLFSEDSGFSPAGNRRTRVPRRWRRRPSPKETTLTLGDQRAYARVSHPSTSERWGASNMPSSALSQRRGSSRAASREDRAV